MQSMSVPLKRLAVGIAALAAFALFFLRNGEVITVIAIHDVSLLDPSTLAGQIGDRPKVVGVLSSGSTIYVSGCNPRKSDIDLEVQFNGKTAVVGGKSGDFQLIRHRALLTEEHAISSCRGLFCGSSECS